MRHIEPNHPHIELGQIRVYEEGESIPHIRSSKQGSLSNITYYQLLDLLGEPTYPNASSDDKDPNSDLALLKIDDKKLPFLEFDDSKIHEDLHLNHLRGVLISKVLVNSAAYNAGLKNFDVILDINGIEVNSTSELHELVIQYQPGEEINCTIRRNEMVKEVKLFLQA